MPEKPNTNIEQVTAEIVYQQWISQDELCARLSIGPELLELCLQWDVIHPPRITSEGNAVFPGRTLDRLCSGLRRHRDLGIDWSGGSLVLDLLERIEELETRMHAMQPPNPFTETGADHDQ